MKGTVEQIKWAEQIKTIKLTQAKESLAEYNLSPDMEVKAIDQLTTLFESEQDASWWIERRVWSYSQIARELGL